MPPGSPNPDPVSDPKMLFSSPVFKSTYPYSDLDVVTKRSVYMGRNYVERFRKIYLNADYSFFFIHLELKRQIRSYTPVVSS